MPRATRRELDSRSVQIPDGEVNIPLTGDAALERSGFDIIDGPAAMKKADELAFMEERVTIIVHETEDPNAENPVSVTVNGRNQFIFRGQPIDVKRKFVERLARAKKTGYRQHLDDTSDPVRYNKLYTTTGITYPFSVIHDPNPRGMDWLRKIMAEA